MTKGIPLSANITKWSNTLKQFVDKLPTNCLSVFDHFVGLTLKGLLRLAITLTPICNCGTAEETIDYLLHFLNFSNERHTLFNKFQSIDDNILSKNDSNILNVGKHSCNDVKNTSVLIASIEYIISAKLFDASLYQNWHLSICLCGVCF